MEYTSANYENKTDSCEQCVCPLTRNPVCIPRRSGVLCIKLSRLTRLFINQAPTLLRTTERVPYVSMYAMAYGRVYPVPRDRANLIQC